MTLLRLANLAIGLERDENTLRQAAARRLRVAPESIRESCLWMPGTRGTFTLWSRWRCAWTGRSSCFAA